LNTISTTRIVRAWATGPSADDPRPTGQGTSAPPTPPKRPRRATIGWRHRIAGAARQITTHLPKSRPAIPRAPLNRSEALLRGSLGMLAVIIFGFLINLTGLSQLQHLVAQTELRNTFAQQLADGTAPVSEGDYNNVLLTDGAPVARIEIPSLGVSEIVAEGTSAAVLADGPGHRRDTVLPGQAGVSVLMGRASAYGGPFGRIRSLTPGATINVLTGQGEHRYEVLGIRYAGDPAPAPVTTGEGRLILESARGGPYLPTGVVRVDAKLASAVQADGARQTSYATLPAADKELASDTTTAWALIFALQFLVLAEVGAVWSLRRFGGPKTWVVLVPVLLLSGLLVADQLTRLLPNLM